jgi:hypothetical protein
MKKFSISDLKKEISKKYGSVSGLKKFLKDTAKYEYGGYTNEVNVYGCRIVYTDNPNCFASFLISIPMVGFNSQFALGKSSLTKAGKIRLGSRIDNHYIKI